MTYAERRALQEGPQPQKRAPRTTPVPERKLPGLTVKCPVCKATPGVECWAPGPLFMTQAVTHIARIQVEVSQS